MKLDEVYIQQELERILPHREDICSKGCCCGVDDQRERVMKLILEVCAERAPLTSKRHSVFNCLACGTVRCKIHFRPDPAEPMRPSGGDKQ